MEFLNPGAFYAAALLPLLLIPYLIRSHRRRQLFSSLLLFQELAQRPESRKWRWLKLPPIFFLQLLLLGLLLLALAEPLVSLRPTKVAVVIDNSASMQALEGRKSRFELAREEALSLIRSASGQATVGLYVTVPRLEAVGREALTPAEALGAIDRLKPYDLGEPSDGLGEKIAGLKKEKEYDRLYFLTDHRAARPVENVRIVSIGKPKSNLAITSFDVSRPVLASPRLKAALEVQSFSTVEEKVKISVKTRDKVLATRSLTVPSGRSAGVTFDDLPRQAYYEASLEISDGLAVDNRRFALPPSDKSLRILAVSPRPDSFASLRAVPGISVKVIGPEAYEKSREEEHSLEIFHYSSPAAFPAKHALFILPPRENPVVSVGQSLTRPVISGWREPHPLTGYVNFALFRPSFGRVLSPLSFGDDIVKSPSGSLAIAVERQGFRYLALGFDPFPYLGRDNLPVSIFTLNMLKWFQEGLEERSMSTGEPIRLALKGGLIVSPAGEKFSIEQRADRFTGTFLQGLYEIHQGGERELRAVNLQDVKESDLRSASAIAVPEEAGSLGARASLWPLWATLLLACAALLCLEWFLNPPAADAGPVATSR
jgi:hypothetical protein